jgi:low temperature requirement protein LtrA
MTEGRAGELLRQGGGEGPKHPTFLELFLDLVYVFALTRVTQRLVKDFTSDRHAILSEVGQTTLLLLALWWAWSITAWVTSRYNPLRPALQFVVLAVMFCSMLMAVALPKAFGESALIFAGAYVAIQVGRQLFTTLALTGHKQWRIPARGLCWFAVSAVPWIAGALLQGAAQGVLWTVAVVVDYAGLALGWPTPWLGRSRVSELPIAGEHLAERYQQFLIIALGESILVTGITFSTSGFRVDRTAGLIVSFMTTVLLWRIYVYPAGQAFREAVAVSTRPARLSQSANYTHLILVAGIVATAVGYPLVIEHALGHTDRAWLAVILGGPALFLAGRARFEYEVFGRVSRSSVTGLLVLAALAPAMVLGTPLTAAVCAVLVLVGIAVADAARERGRLPKPSPANL